MSNHYYVAMFIGAIIILIVYSLFPLYNKVNPQLLGLPFFYWYQIVMLGFSTIISLVIVLLIKEERGVKA